MTVMSVAYLFLRKLGYGQEDIEQPDALGEYMPALLTWLQEGGMRVQMRLTRGVGTNLSFALDGEMPTTLPEGIQYALADYAAARALEERGDGQRASLFHASFERALSLHVRAGTGVRNTLLTWRDL